VGSALPALFSRKDAKCECLLYSSSLLQVPGQRFAAAGIHLVMKNRKDEKYE